ncbi:hypothetical protein [Amycolatopsis magusensis]|uniref:Uncharacterized protein n=1 Tax=Amycolatopsis magusensis TaxID=882444 RepID=A0ABS4PS25_9PSEU|nr:hypothetical protein [Amycolatopsis magusensis]MBP2182230.1 hypothetical protein [Amycolatopsis magusensis]
MVVASAVGAAALALASPVIAEEEAPGESTGIRTVVQIAQPASAAEVAALDLSIQADSHGCSGNEASNNSYVHVCFVRDGDKIFVKDDEGNSRSAVGQLEFYDAGTWYWGYCLNPNTAASGIWVYCGFGEADENTTAYYRGFDAKDGTADAHFTDWHSESTS